jgi:hypothetical protein
MLVTFGIAYIENPRDFRPINIISILDPFSLELPDIRGMTEPHAHASLCKSLLRHLICIACQLLSVIGTRVIFIDSLSLIFLLVIILISP